MSTLLGAITLSFFSCLTLPADASQSIETSMMPVSAIMHFMHDVNPNLAGSTSLQYARAVIADAQSSQVDPCLLLAIVGVESHFKASAVSKHGAIGLGQLLPTTAQDLHVDPSSPLANLRGTSQYLRSLLNRFAFLPGHERTVIAAYNAGPNAIARNHGEPTSSANAIYVQRVLLLWQAAKSRVGSFRLAPVIAMHKDMPSTTETLADRQAGWWTSEGSNDPVSTSDNTLAKRILHL